MRKRILMMLAAGDLTAGTQDYIPQHLTQDTFKFRNWTVTSDGTYVSVLDEDDDAINDCTSTCSSNDCCHSDCFNRHTNTMCVYNIRTSMTNCFWLHYSYQVDRDLQCGNSIHFVKEKWFEIFWESDVKVRLLLIYYLDSSYKERRWRLHDTPAFEQIIFPIRKGDWIAYYTVYVAYYMLLIYVTSICYWIA
jgi:hypothetical protein